MDTLHSETHRGRPILGIFAFALVGFFVFAAADRPTPLDEFRAEDPHGALACQELTDWLEADDVAAPALRLHHIGYQASFASTPAVKETAGLIEYDDRFAALRGDMMEQMRSFGYGDSTAYADDLATLDTVCAAQGIDMPEYHPLV